MNGKPGLWTIAAVATLILISTGGVGSASFTDITTSSGTGGPNWYGGHGIQFGDATGDGRPDLYVTINANQDMADLFYRNTNGASFVEEANLRGIASFDTGSHGGVWADLDNDGDFDLFNGAYQRNRIYRNNGSGFFTDVTVAANLPDRQWLTRAVLTFDMDNDGDLDLFAVTGYLGTNDPVGEKNEVYRNDGNMVFTAVNSGALYDAPVGQGATDSDFDGDGDIDIIAANRTGAVNILRNDGDGNFQLVAPDSVGINHTAGDGITLADVNNDGHLDLLLQKNLYLNAGNNTYVFKKTFTAPGYMGGFEDLDNDGDWDLVFSGDNKVYYNDGSGNYTASPTFATGPINDPRAMAFADIEGDGDMDFFYAQKNTYSRLIRNDYQGGNRWLKIKLERSSGQAGAYGAKVYIYDAGQLGVAGSRITWREARSQEGYLGQNDPVLHFGVGANDQVDVRVVFLGGATVEQSFVNAGRTITVNESGVISDCILDSRFDQTTLAVGLKYYTDRDYVLTAVPAAYSGMAAIKTPNDDRNLTTPATYLTFEMPVDGTVYVAYDSRATALPDWLAGFAYTGATIETSLSTQPHLLVYGKTFAAGDCVNLGPNMAAGFAGDTASNYLVFYGTNGPPPVCVLDPRFGQTSLAVGLNYYTDRDYALTAVPAAYSGMAAITTPNDDRDLTTPLPGYLNFEMPVDGTVYVAYDSRATGLPDWMNGFSDTGAIIETSLSTQPYLKVYSKTFAENDCVNLGANKAAGFAGDIVSNYIVFYGTGGSTPTCALNARFGQTTLSVGNEYYTDRAYQLTAVPLAYLGMAMVTTPNDDRNLTTPLSGYLNFEMPVDGTVYVAYDSRATGLPDWMNGFSDTGATIETSLSTQPHMKVYSKTFAEYDCVNLGANKAAGFAGDIVSNYIVFYGAGVPTPTCALDARFRQTTLSVGNEYYTDRAYQLTAVPSAYLGMAMVTTPNDDRDLTTPLSGYLNFEMPVDGTVYVAYDSRATGLPDWMNDFSDTGATIETSLSTQPYLKVYGKPFTKDECVNLGANKAAGFEGDIVSNYIVFYGASGPPDETPPVWQGQSGICSAQDVGQGDRVRIDFGTAFDDISGTNVDYNIYYAPTAVWNGSDWSVNQQLAGAVPTAGDICANGYTIDGLAAGTNYTFGVRAVDASGNEETNINTVTATPTGVVQNSFEDDFSTDTRSEYVVDNYWTTGGNAQFLYDSSGQRLRVITGDDIGVRFNHGLPSMDTGVFQMDFRPTVGYPDGSKMKVRLRADADTYYEVYNSDGYGAQEVAKYVDGVKVDSTFFLREYSQGTNYRITLFFSPQALIVEAFGETIILDNDPSAIAVSMFEVVVQQQDAYFDNVALLDQAFVNLSSPVSYQFQSGGDIAARAHTGNLQTGGGVKFVLSDFDTGVLLEDIEDFSEPYEHLFAGLAKGSYSVEALVIDSAGQPVAGVYTHHLAEPVGIGDDYVAFGDSITFGVGDDIAADDVSDDGYTSGGGYGPVLANLLANYFGYPHVIANEGGPGDTSAEALDKLPGVLARHPESEFFLILLGSNDSFDLSVTSGLDSEGNVLNPGDPGYAGSFLSNMQQIIDLVVAAGKEPILAKVPITFGDCSSCPSFADPDMADRNQLIQDYNVVIGALAAANGIAVVPPDFYDYFRSHPGEFSDNVHPDGTGYVSMADLWYQALTN